MILFDFADSQAAREWASIDDTVMGGVSTSRIESTGEGSVTFAGNVSLANNGGFASVRSEARARNLSGFAGISLRIRGDGNRYKVNLKHDASFDGVLYRAAFETARGEWQTVRLRFEDFVPTFRGRVIRDAEPLHRERIVSIGLMISDRQAGPFRLEVARIEAFED